METCKTCKFWERHVVPTDKSMRRLEPFTRFKDWGTCDLFNSEDEQPEHSEALAIARSGGRDGFNWFGWFETNENFGCNQHQPATDGEGLV